MSNTADISPYAPSSQVDNETSDGAVVAGGIVLGAVVGAVALAAWLGQTTDQDKRAVADGKAAMKKEALAAAKCRQGICCAHDSAIVAGKGGIAGIQKQAVVSDLGVAGNMQAVRLHLKNTETLVAAAHSLGYQIEKPKNIHLKTGSSGTILLRRINGERLALQKGDDGRIALLAARSSTPAITELVRAHTVERAKSFLAASGMNVTSAVLKSGESQIIAREKQAKADGKATVKAHVRGDGSVWVDVDELKGGRCEKIVSGLAEAVGGQASSTVKKESFFSLPGEPARIKTGL